MPRFAAILAGTAILCLLGASSGPSATVRSLDVSETVRTFLLALADSSPATCDLASPALQAEIATITKRATCAETMADLKQETVVGIEDEEKAMLVDTLACQRFADFGWVTLNRNPLPTDLPNRRTLRGAGFGVTWAEGDKWFVKASVAWHRGEPALSDVKDRLPRVYLQASRQF